MLNCYTLFTLLLDETEQEPVAGKQRDGPENQLEVDFVVLWD